MFPLSAREEPPSIFKSKCDKYFYTTLQLSDFHSCSYIKGRDSVSFILCLSKIE